MQQIPETVHVNLWIQTKWIFMEEYSTLEEEQWTQLNQKYKQLHSEN